MRHNKPISHHISSPIWSMAKHKLPSIFNNASWGLGKGRR